MLQPCLLTRMHAQATVPVTSLLLMSTLPPGTPGTLPVPIVQQQTKAPWNSHSKKADSFKKTGKAGLLAEHTPCPGDKLSHMPLPLKTCCQHHLRTMSAPEPQPPSLGAWGKKQEHLD